METKPRRRVSSCNRESLLPKRSTLMSKTRLSKQEDGSMRCCFKCWEPFCIDCKAPWHKNLSCEDYKRLCPILTVDVVLNVVANQKKWRQCNNCKHVIERSGGCYRVTCRYNNSLVTISTFFFVKQSQSLPIIYLFVISSSN